jgi:hypothetical protein
MERVNVQSLGKFKRGDTFHFTADVVDEATLEPLIGAASNLRCQGRDGRNRVLITELIITEQSPGTYLFTSDEPTNTWRQNSRILFDLEYSINGEVVSSETFYVEVEADITYDEPST